MVDNDRTPVLSFDNLRKVCAELALVIKFLSQRGFPCDAPFNVLCILFTPLVRKIAPKISRKRRTPLDEVEQELYATLFELVVNFDWARCVDGNLFALYVKRCLYYVTDFRIMRINKTQVSAGMYAAESLEAPEPDENESLLYAVLNMIEERKGSKSADLLFCLFGLQMSQTDAGRIFKVPQVTVSKWWRDLLHDVRNIVIDLPDFATRITDRPQEVSITRVAVSYDKAFEAASKLRETFQEFPILSAEISKFIKPLENAS